MQSSPLGTDGSLRPVCSFSECKERFPSFFSALLHCGWAQVPLQRYSHYYLDTIATKLEALCTGRVCILYPTHPLRVAYPSFLYVPSMVYTVSAVYILSLPRGHYHWGLAPSLGLISALVHP